MTRRHTVQTFNRQLNEFIMQARFKKRETEIQMRKVKEWFEKFHDPITGSRRDNWVSLEEFIMMDKK